MTPSDSVPANPNTQALKGIATVDSYHVASSKQALGLEYEYAAHNYHPLPVVFAKGQGVLVWDPEVGELCLW